MSPSRGRLDGEGGELHNAFAHRHAKVNVFVRVVSEQGLPWGSFNHRHQRDQLSWVGNPLRASSKATRSTPNANNLLPTRTRQSRPRSTTSTKTAGQFGRDYSSTTQPKCGKQSQQPQLHYAVVRFGKLVPHAKEEEERCSLRHHQSERPPPRPPTPQRQHCPPTCASNAKLENTRVLRNVVCDDPLFLGSPCSLVRNVH